ncbi:hypothetical protein V3470_13085 [Flavobacterium oreochromis]|uniref:Uncharacterized protein n=1 Tax=Flavobacterium oreochromis TaxID=2906078 RepID=A0ABW8PBM6_9FLAO|nr:hypothetical protein [Flavobacterium oreochromis]
MRTKNINLINSYTQYSNAIIDRNQTPYSHLTELTETTKEVKLHIKSIFGANSLQYKQVSTIEFSKVR